MKLNGGRAASSGIGIKTEAKMPINEPDILGSVSTLDLHSGPSSGRYELAAPECVADDFGGEIVAINLKDGLYFSLRGLAHAVWQDLIAGLPPTAILDGLAVVDTPLSVATAAFIADLERRGLIRPSTLAVVTDHSATSVSFAQQGSEPPAIEVFDDMADLIMADPIHEVDEEHGWPVRREAAR